MFFALAAPVLAGDLEAPGLPAAGSGMPTTTEIYDRLKEGAAAPAPGGFREPAAAPAPSGRTLAEIGARLPAPDNVSGATAAEVAAGKRFWGLRTDGTWGPTSGSAAAGGDVSGPNGALTFPIPDGIYAGRHATAADSNLTAGNIRSGVSVFGVNGSAPIASGTAAAGDVLTGKSFSNGSGTGITGAMPDNGAVSITPTTSAQTIPAGYHNGAGAVAGDAGLVSGNIRSGATLFGVSGSVTAATGNAGAGDVLAGKSFSNDSAAGINGTMPDRGAVNITPSTSSQTIPAGYHNGTGSVAGDPNLVAGNIRNGVTLFGVTGSLSVGINASRVSYFECISPFTGPTCDDCVSPWTGPNCNVCPSGRAGASCDILEKPFPGAVPSYAGAPWGCVQDTASGLTWEVKTRDGGLHDISNYYTWYSSSDVDQDGRNNGKPGAPGCTTTGCDTEKFVAAVNTTGWCGYNDWRLPTTSELRGLITGTTPPLIDATYYPNTEAFFYWTADPGADLDSAAVVDFFRDMQTVYQKRLGLPVRLVRP